MNYVFPPPAFVPLVLFKLLAEDVTGKCRLHVLVSSWSLEASWLLIILNMLEDDPNQCFLIKDLIIDVLVDFMLKGLPLLHLWLLQ